MFWIFKNNSLIPVFCMRKIWACGYKVEVHWMISMLSLTILCGHSYIFTSHIQVSLLSI